MRKFITALSVSIAVVCFAVSLWGSARFPYAPIKKTDSGYLDKFGHVETAEEYQAFLRWYRMRGIFGGALAIFTVASIILHYRTVRVDQKAHRSPRPRD